MILRFFLMSTKTRIEDEFHKRIISFTAVLSISVFISIVFPHQVFISASAVERLTFLYIDVHDNISIYFTMSDHQESIWDHSR